MWKKILPIMILFTSCNEKQLVIEPVDKNYNRTNIYQYYQISNYENLSNEELMNKINDFIEKEYLNKKENNFTAYFYKKSFLINYKNHLNEDEIDSEMGFLSNFKSKKLGLFFSYTKDQKNRIYNKIVYDEGNIVLERTDTISIK